MITLTDVETARERIATHVRHTPTMLLERTRSPLPFANVVAKLELHQVTGSFKARGAMNKLLATPPDQLIAGIVTASGGNHGLAVARTAHVAGVPAVVYVPAGVSPAKVTKMRSWGADVRIVGQEWGEANDAALAYSSDCGAAYFHPFADPLIVAGQGTLGLEIIEDIAQFDTLVVAIGGGGLVSGVSTAVRAHRPGVRIIGVEPQGSPTLKASLDAGSLVSLKDVTSSVPTMSCRQTVEPIFQTVRTNVSDIVLVSDDDLLHASRLLWSEFGIAADLAGAASIAALSAGHTALRNAGKICAIVCGSGLEGAVS